MEEKNQQPLMNIRKRFLKQRTIKYQKKAKMTQKAPLLGQHLHLRGHSEQVLLIIFILISLVILINLKSFIHIRKLQLIRPTRNWREDDFGLEIKIHLEDLPCKTVCLIFQRILVLLLKLSLMVDVFIEKEIKVLLENHI